MIIFFDSKNQTQETLNLLRKYEYKRGIGCNTEEGYSSFNDIKTWEIHHFLKIDTFDKTLKDGYSSIKFLRIITTDILTDLKTLESLLKKCAKFRE